MNRLKSIDFLRGLVMVIMALDHTRDLMHVDALTQDPTNLATTTPALFFTRWITHLCAPTFVFLTGVSAFLSFQRQNDPSVARRFLLTRGLWLIFLEFTIVNFGIWFDISFGILMSQVIAAIGFGLVILSFLLRLSSRTIGMLGLITIFGHDLLANVNFPNTSPLHYIWGYLFRVSFWQISPNFSFFVNYPLIPWLGILLAGYGLGQFFLQIDSQRRKILGTVGITALAVFVVLRTFNLYGDPQLWNYTQKHWTYSILSFMNVSKYPPSLLYTAATLGVSMLILYYFDGKTNRFMQIICVYGKVPLFYYLIHWYVLHCLMLILMLFQGFNWSDLNFAPFGFGRPQQGGGVGLVGVYAIWLTVVAVLYPLCLWYSRYKAAHPEKVWLRYL